MSSNVSPELQNKLIVALADYFSSVELDETTPEENTHVPLEWTLGSESTQSRWPVSFVQIREGGDGVGEFPAYSACVELQENLSYILSFHVRFVLYKNGKPHAVHHYNPELPITIMEFDWDGPFVVAVEGGALHLFEKELYVDMANRTPY